MPKRKKIRVKKKLNVKTVAILCACLVLGMAGLYFKSTKISAPILPKPSLKELSLNHGISLGNFAIANRLNDKIYTGILTSQFDFILADNTPNWYFTDGGLRPGPNSYNFKQMDKIVAFAQSRNMAIQAHHYVWGEQKWLPDWLKRGNYTKQQLLDLVKQHILIVGRHYSGKIAMWTVVNEPFTRQAHLYNLRDWWADHTGGQTYIADSFIWARQADPKSKLILNDFNNESINETSNAMYSYVKDALGRGVPIDGIGMQMHLDGTKPPDKQSVIANMKRFAALGLGVYITEFDVNMNDVPGSSSIKNRIEGDIYYSMMRACIESQVCHSFAYLGITDSETWYNYVGAHDPRPLMFDTKYRPKPAFYATRAALELK